MKLKSKEKMNKMEKTEEMKKKKIQKNRYKSKIMKKIRRKREENITKYNRDLKICSNIYNLTSKTADFDR